MSSSAAPNAIRIPVVVDIDQATGKLQGLRRVADTETKGAASDIVRNLSGAERDVAGHTEGMARSFHGLRPAIHAATDSLALMGVEGNHAVSGLTLAFSHLADGVSPAVAGIALLATGIGALVSHFKEQEAEAEKAAEHMKHLATAVDDVTGSLARAYAESAKFHKLLTDIAVGESGDPKEIASLEIAVEAQKLKASRLTAYGDIRNEYEILEGLQNELRVRKENYNEALNLVRITRVLAELQAEWDAKAYAKSSDQGSDRANAMWGLRMHDITPAQLAAMSGQVHNPSLPFDSGAVAAGGNLGIPGFAKHAAPDGTTASETKAVEAATTAEKERLQVEQQLRALQSGAAEKTIALADEITTKQKELNDLKAWATENEQAEVDARQKEIDALTATLGLEQKVTTEKEKQDKAKKASDKYQQEADAAGKQFGDGITGGIETALLGLAHQDPWAPLLMNLATGISDTILSAVIKGFLKASGVQQAAEGLGQQIFSAFAPAAAGAAGAGAGGGASAPAASGGAPAGETIVIAMVPDAPAADAMIAKASARGMRAGVAKGTGQGVMVGSLKPRRRR